MRGYFLTNMYLSPIQRGIQSAHCIHDMYETYLGTGRFQPGAELLHTWAQDHKTMIVLNGGTSDELQAMFDFLMRNIEDYPFEKFNEPGIGGALTCVGIILTQRMVELISWIRDDAILSDDVATGYSDDERALATMLAYKPLA